MNHPVRNLTKSQRAASAQRFYRLFVRAATAFNALKDLRVLVGQNSEVNVGDKEKIVKAIKLIQPLMDRYQSRWRYEDDTFRNQS